MADFKDYETSLLHILDDFQKVKVRNAEPGDTLTIQMPDGSSPRFEVTEENHHEFTQFGVGDADPNLNDAQFSNATAECSLVGRIDQFTMATCAYMWEVVAGPGSPSMPYPIKASDSRQAERVKRKKLKAESKAQELLRQIIGVEQWRVYRKACRVIVKPGRHFWVIGNMFGNYDKFNPFGAKPDVVRIDNAKKLHITDFCVDQAGGDSTPYTDKVVTFATFLINDELGFVKTINRIGERTINEMKPCAVWEVKK